MLRIKLSPVVSRVAGAAAAASLLGGGLSACAADEDGLVASEGDEINSIAPGVGVIALHGSELSYASESGGDELLRSKEKMSVEATLGDVIRFLDSADRKIAQAKQDMVTTTVEVRFFGRDGKEMAKDSYDLDFGKHAMTSLGKSSQFVIPENAPRMEIDLVVGVPGGKGARASNVLGFVPSYPVFGAYLPNKLALFDMDGAGRMRDRIVEGGGLIRGARATVAYSDWRADRVVDKGSLDLRIGQTQSGNRFGPAIVDAFGELAFEVEAVYTTDGEDWSAVSLATRVDPEVLKTQPNRKRRSYEGGIELSKDAKQLRMAFRVRAYLVVPPKGQMNLINARHEPGTRVLLREAWDNNEGRDYTLGIDGL